MHQSPIQREQEFAAKKVRTGLQVRRWCPARSQAINAKRPSLPVAPRKWATGKGKIMVAEGVGVSALLITVSGPVWFHEGVVPMVLLFHDLRLKPI